MNAPIRPSVKAAVIKDGLMLFNKSTDENGSEYNSLPGGGVNKFETLEHALVRECLEETGYAVRVLRFLGVYEEIYAEGRLRESYPEQAHKLYFYFLCELEHENRVTPFETDDRQIGCEWLPVKSLQNPDFYPAALREKLITAINSGIPEFFGSNIFKDNC